MTIVEIRIEPRGQTRSGVKYKYTFHLSSGAGISRFSG